MSFSAPEDARLVSFMQCEALTTVNRTKLWLNKIKRYRYHEWNQLQLLRGNKAKHEAIIITSNTSHYQ